MQMNKTDLIKMVAEKANKPTKEVAEIIDLKSATKPFNVLLACTCPLLLN